MPLSNVNLSSVDFEINQIVSFFLSYLDEESLVFLQEELKGEILSFENQLLIRYRSKYPIHKLEDIKHHLYYLALFRKTHQNNTGIYIFKKIVFKELDKFFSDKKPNKFLDWFESHPVFSTAIIGTVFSAVISSIIGAVVAKLMS